MSITFSGEAYETFQRVIVDIQGYTVEVTPWTDDSNDREHGEPFTAVIEAPDNNSEWGDAILVRRFDETKAEPVGDIFSVRAAALFVH